jgi:integrase/recombinase XerD
MLIKFAIQDFLDDMKLRNLSEKHIKETTKTLQIFQEFCASREVVDTDDIRPQLISTSYMSFLMNEKANNPTTRNNKFRVIKTFFNFLEKNGEVSPKRNPAKGYKKAVEEIKIEVYTDEHINKMLSFYKRSRLNSRSFASYRDYMIIVTMLGTGIRLGEMINLEWNWVNIHARIMSVDGKKRQTSSVPMTDKLAKELSEYYVFCKQYFGSVGRYVFPSMTTNDKMTVDTAKSIFRSLKNEMKFDDVRLSAHTFRHTFAHRMIMAGCDTFTLQKMLRHSQIAMTQRYVAMWGTALKEQNDKYNPLNSLSI